MIHQEGDQRWVTTAGSALHLLQSVYGSFSKVYGIGRCAKVRICDKTLSIIDLQILVDENQGSLSCHLSVYVDGV